MIAESAETAVIYGMPKEVIEAGAADRVLPLGQVGEAIIELVTQKKLAGRRVGVLMSLLLQTRQKRRADVGGDNLSVIVT